MSGRGIFRIARGPLNFLSAALRLFPVPVRMIFWRLVEWLPGLAGVGLRYVVASSLASRVGDNVFIDRNVEIKNWQGLSLGSNVSIHRWCYIDAIGGISIGDEVSIAHNCSILSFDHDPAIVDVAIKYAPIKARRVVIEPDVWLGCGVRVLSGVVIGRRTVVAAGAVVTRDIQAYSLAGGIPARKIRSLPGCTPPQLEESK